MSQKNETISLIFALFITLALLGAITWWLTHSFGFNIDNFSQPKSNNSTCELPTLPCG